MDKYLIKYSVKSVQQSGLVATNLEMTIDAESSMLAVLHIIEFEQSIGEGRHIIVHEIYKKLEIVE